MSLIFWRSQIGDVYTGLDFCVQRVIPTEARSPRPEGIPDFGDCSTIGALFCLSFSATCISPDLGVLVYPAECSEVSANLCMKSRKAPRRACGPVATGNLITYAVIVTWLMSGPYNSMARVKQASRTRAAHLADHMLCLINADLDLTVRGSYVVFVHHSFFTSPARITWNASWCRGNIWERGLESGQGPHFSSPIHSDAAAKMIGRLHDKNRSEPVTCAQLSCKQGLSGQTRAASAAKVVWFLTNATQVGVKEWSRGTCAWEYWYLGLRSLALISTEC